jgi:hypothetical protein
MGIPGPVSSAAAVPGALNAVRAYGDSLFVVTHQPEMAWDTFCRGRVQAIHGLRLQAAASIGDGRP